ncbi:MAG: CDP-diacylglycerol--glycerol-3-phosphate 3-phosphatidyltransferase, partial [Syntrophomonas sp.]|nr:CDP-diacylglycerol--glycerol-3-phosphate 3-phosphatidyltransferase [Syntrophomonas sp.]
SSSKMGKLKTISQIIAVLVIMLQNLFFPLASVNLGHWAMYIALVITIVSGIEYFYKNKINY